MTEKKAERLAVLMFGLCFGAMMTTWALTSWSHSGNMVEVVFGVVFAAFTGAFTYQLIREG